MLPRDTVLRQIRHEETPRAPYALPIEEEVGRRLDAHYGSAAWRERLEPYIVTVRAVETDIRVPFGTPKEIEAEVARLRREMARGGGYILAPAKPLQPETPTANAVSVLESFTARDGWV